MPFRRKNLEKEEIARIAKQNLENGERCTAHVASALIIETFSADLGKVWKFHLS
jgi:hypothetical protein